MRDRIRGYTLRKSRYQTLPTSHHRRDITRGRLYRGTPAYQSYTCPLCHYHQSLPASKLGYRCPSCGLRMRRERIRGLEQARRRERGLGLFLSLSP
jgi:DNA-directed RNA polymerase subunit RPC12/RpoP